MKLKYLWIACLSGGAYAAPHIEEVQPWPIDGPQQLVIWGNDFGVDPQIFFGTSSTPLVISADQGMCPQPDPTSAPPLDASGKDCIVVDLPVVEGGEPSVPAGDYLLKIEAYATEACLAKPRSLTFEYLPADCSGANLQDASCSGSMEGSALTATLTAEGSNNSDWVMSPSDMVNAGDMVIFSKDPNSKNIPNNLGIFMDDGSLLSLIHI